MIDESTFARARARADARGRFAATKARLARKVRRRREMSPRHFVDFVLRHTWPERAFRHGLETVHSIIKHHPFAIAHGGDGTKQDQ